MLRNLFKKIYFPPFPKGVGGFYSTREIKKRLKKFLKKTPHSEASVIVTLKTFPVWYEEGIMRDMAIEALFLLWKQYYKDLLAVQEYMSCSRMVLAYRKAITTYVHRVLAAKREAEKARIVGTDKKKEV